MGMGQQLAGVGPGKTAAFSTFAAGNKFGIF